MQKDKVRVYQLARSLKMESKDLLDICHQAGYDVKNQLSNLEPDQREAIENLVRNKKSGGGGVAVAAPPAAPSVTHLPGRPVVLTPQRPPVLAAPRPAPKPTEPKPLVAPTPTELETGERAPAAAIAAPEAPGVETEAPPVLDPAAQQLDTTTAGQPAGAAPRVTDLAAPMRNLSAGRLRPGDGTQPGGPAGQRRRELPRPTHVRATHGLTAHPKPKPLPAKDDKKAQEPAGPKKIAEVTPDLINRLTKGGTKDIARELIERLKHQQSAVAPVAPEETPAGEEDDRRPGSVRGRDERHKQRSQRAKARRAREEVTLQPGALVGDEEENRTRKRLVRIRKPELKKGTQPRKGRIPLLTPITVRSLCEALGRQFGEVHRKLAEHGLMATINTVIQPDIAEVLAVDFGVELDIKKPLDAEEQIIAKLQGEDAPDDQQTRAPIVTVMGHVDHGKTSLLDRIRESNVVATEAGGITQHLRAWRVEHNGKPITFLDTPGHEAFTQMRARGAQVTDIVVLVVAADDGVMPQTEEAISHAKAAEVPIIVAINKIDLPNANLNRTRQQLYAQSLIPDDMGGTVQFVETVATKDKAKGIAELLEKINLVSDYELELKANPNKPGHGTCLEAKLSEGEGVVATLLLQNGTLRKGDAVVCGTAFGRVRQMYDDHGQPIEEAGPSLPARITGLDQVPNADDPFHVVPDLTVAREIAEKRLEKQRAAVPVKLSTFRLEDLDKAKVEELKLIIKADVRGSIEAIRKEMGKLIHDEVRVHILHTGVGAITEGDVQLALASPKDTLIVGFNVVPDDRARSLADQQGIQIRQYDIIYQLTDDIKAALQGKLKPREEVVHLGRAVVRETFKISRVGTIAGCYVTQGTIERSAKVRLIREGVVIYPPADKTAALDSLKRFKDDVREVREGFECGMKIAGYDDVKVGDVIEAFKVEQVQRTL